MQLRNWVPVLASAILFVLQGTASQAQEAIGKATSVRPQAEGSRAGPLSGGSDVHSQETIRTGNAGQADMQFRDSSKLKVGASSSVKLDKFVYDPNKSGGTVADRSNTRHVSICNRITGRGGLQGQDPLWHPWGTRLRNSIAGTWVPTSGWALRNPHQQAVHLVGTRALPRAACVLVSQLCPYAPTATTRPVSTAIRDASSVDQPMRELRLAR